MDINIHNFDQTMVYDAQFSQIFEAEGDSGLLLTYARLSDGTIRDISTSQDLNFTSIPSSLSVTQNTHGQYIIRVLEGAETNIGRNLKNHLIKN